MTDGASGAVAAEQPARAWFDRVYAALPLVTAFIALLALYAWEAARHTSPWLFTDELELTQISRAVEATGHGARRGDPYFWQTLYTWLIAPAWAITSTTLAYTVVKYIGVVTMTLSLFPAYFLARTVASPRASLFAAVGTAAVPALVYAPMILEEPLSYPYAALAFLAIATALARRTVFWIAAAIVLSLVGGFIRGELGILPVVLVLAAGLYALSSEAARRWRSQFTAWDWVGAIVLGAGAVILFSGLVGKFSQSWAIATGHYQGRMLDYGLQAVGALTIGLGLLPVVAAIATLATSKGDRRTPERRAFTSLFVAAAVGFGVYTAVKTAYLSTVAFTRVEERNLIYLVPLVFVGTALWIDRPRVRWIPLAAAVGFVAYLIVATPYQLTTVPASDSPGVAIVQMANRNLSFAHGGIENALIIALVIAVCLLVAPRLLRGRRRAASAVVAVACLLVLAWSLTGQISAANYSNNEAQALVANYPRPLDWLDELTHGKPTLYLGQNLNSGTDLGVWLTEFWNRSLRYVWSVDGSAPGPGPTQTPNTTVDGRLYPVADVDYVLAEKGVVLDGTVVGNPSTDGPLGPLQGAGSRSATRTTRQESSTMGKRAAAWHRARWRGARTTASPRRASGQAMPSSTCRASRPAARRSRRRESASRSGRSSRAPTSSRTSDTSRTSSAGRCGSGRRAGSSCLRRRRPSASRCGSRRRIRRSSSAAPTSASSAARSGTASRSGRWRRA